MGNFDVILENIGPFGKYQIVNWLVVSLAFLVPGSQNVLNVYLQAVPEHWCTSVDIPGNITTADIGPLPTASPSEDNGDPSCKFFNVTSLAAFTAGQQHDEPLSCTEWDYDLSVYGETAVSKWDLVCNSGSLPSLAQSIYMLGFLVGAAIFGYLSDRIGRLPTLNVSILGVIIFGVVSAFIPSFWGHVFVRMLAGMCSAGCISSAFVMEMEIIGIDKRLGPGLSAQVFFAFGYMGLAGLACAIKDFVWLNVTISLIPAVLICYWWVLAESPRWLMARGRMDQARKGLTKAGRMNKADVDVDQLIQDYKASDNEKSQQDTSDVNYTILDLLRTPNMRNKTLNMTFNWLVTSMVYYGLSMGVTDLAGDPYINLFISGVSECLGVILAFVTLDRFGRRPCLALVLIVGGVACIISGVLPSDYSVVIVVLSMVGKCGVSASFAIIYVFTAEMFPTFVRTIAVGTASCGARVGALLAPFVAFLRLQWMPLPMIIFGGFAIAAGVLSMFFPETLGMKLPETMEEGEEFGKNVKFFQIRPNRSKRTADTKKATELQGTRC